MSSVGSTLKATRERRGRSLDDLAAQTKIPRRSLELIEEERWRELPAPVYVKGFIRAYCQAVGADAGEAIQVYEAQLFARGSVPESPLLVLGPPPDHAEPIHRRLKLAHALLLVVAALTFLVALVAASGGDKAGDRSAARPDAAAEGATSAITSFLPGARR